MSDALAVFSSQDLAEAKSLSTTLSKAALVPEALRGKEADILFIVLTGAEMGIGPMKSLQAFESIKGRVGMKPVYMLGMVRAHPSIESIDIVESTATKAVVESKRKGSPKVLRTTFTIDDAKTAGLLSSEMYRKWPAQMLGWRCTAIHCRANHSDIIGGHYTTEEVETFERDVTPVAVAGRVDAQPAVEAAKEAVKAKRRMLIVDAPAASPPRPVVSTDEDEATVGWGGNAKSLLTVLTDDALRRYRDDAEKKAAANADDSRDLWVSRYARYVSELDRRATSAVAQEAVTP